jgi:hypothetical protein
MIEPAELWAFLPLGYLITILVETPVLLLFLARRHPMGTRLLTGVWLTACTYPIVILVLPNLFADRTSYLIVAETFAPLAECILFVLAFGRSTWPRDCAAITVANLLSFGLGEWIF